MRRLNFSLCLIFLMGYSLMLAAQNKVIARLIPHEMTIQYAGNIGIVSVGPTWNYAKNDCLETTLLLGFVPAYHNYESTVCLSVREMYTPWRLNVGVSERISFCPVSLGIMASVTFGEDFWLVEPNYYPDNYYGLSTALRFFVLLSQQFDFKIENYSARIKQISFYYQANTYDLRIVDFFNSKYLKLYDIIGFALGLKIHF